MRVLFNGLTAWKPKTGIGHYSAQLAAGLSELLGPKCFDVWPPPVVGRLAGKCFGHAGPPSKSGSSIKSTIKGGLKTLGLGLLKQHFANHCRSSRYDIYHEPNYLPFPVDVPTVITVHDLSVVRHPEWHPARRVAEHARKLERAIAKAAHVITDTEQVRREIVADFATPAEKITAIHLGVGSQYRPTPRSQSLPEKYFLCVGTIEPRKNLLTVMQAFAALKDRKGTQLLLAGPWGWKADAEYEFYLRNGDRLGIRHLNYVPDDAMPELYSNALATLYPSLYEGFGLPPLESSACGTLTVCSRGTLAVREVMATAARYCEATDIDDWRATMQELLERPKIVPTLSKQFTWRHTAELTASLYQSLSNCKPQPLRIAA